MKPLQARCFSICRMGWLATAMTGGLGVSSGCSQSPEGRQIGFSHSITQECKSRDHSESFFSAKSFATSADDGVSWRDDYSSILAIADEPSLSCGDTFDHAYRLVWVQALRSGSVIIRVSRSHQTFGLVVIRSQEAGPGLRPIISRVSKALTEKQWQMITSAVERTDLWFMPTRHIRKLHEDVVLDASAWLFEGREGSSYHVILRSSSEEESPLVSAWRLFFMLAELTVPDELQS
jgi:hypothetical protein